MLQDFYNITYYHVLDLRRPDAVSAHVDDVIETTSDLVIALLRAISTVTGEEIT